MLRNRSLQDGWAFNITTGSNIVSDVCGGVVDVVASHAQGEHARDRGWEWEGLGRVDLCPEFGERVGYW